MIYDRLRYKAQRFVRFQRKIGILKALQFEILWSLRRDLIGIKVPEIGQKLYIRRFDSDVLVFEQILIDGEFSELVGQNYHNIIDGGANCGFSTAWLASFYPEAKIIAVEPNSESLKMISLNCRHFPNVEIVEGGLWSDDGYLQIEDPDAMSWAMKYQPGHAGEDGGCRAYTIGRLMESTRMNNCDLLKLDIEGAEKEVFSDAENWTHKVAAVLVEVHDDEAHTMASEACPPPSWITIPLGEKLFLRKAAVN